MSYRTKVLLSMIAALGASCSKHDGVGPIDAGSRLDGSLRGAGASGASGSSPTSAGGTGAVIGATGHSDVICGPCEAPLRVLVKTVDGREEQSWSTTLHGEGKECRSDDASLQSCLASLKPGEYDIEVTSGCAMWSKHFRIEANPDPRPPCDCGYIPKTLEFRLPTSCDADAGNDDAGADDAGL